ncbi:haloacid dehalogenase [Amniculicola lignicola CBS 123094]|uniref:Haloacid dehalogenase n=1 Tax=Amniculicola lignicola CBS 123094 TaxID=1392246 RepID=A0A6A5X2M3_9PLEO|nr:haloacid dehalogenase [Amniculicola lignicola CBS 123094]
MQSYRPIQNNLTSPTPLPCVSGSSSRSISMALPRAPRALFFDVFGTCVDWRTTVSHALDAQSHIALNSATTSLATAVRMRASNMTSAHWGDFAQQWRNTYKAFCHSLAADPSLPWKTVDEHHLQSLRELLVEWKLEGLWTDEEVRALSLVWHRLEPWSDSAPGIRALNMVFYTVTLSNGNLGLLADLKAHGSLEFTHLFSAELFGSYKPSPKVYLGAAEKLGLAGRDCAMVAAHLGDLKAAKSNGYMTIYVERAGEEDWSQEEVEKAHSEGWVDLWISLCDQGFIAVAEELGIEFKGSVQVKRSASTAH